ncbi:MAG TPA: hypothetical protein DIW17_19350 [Clostridiales bacterium]|nr:hypothetical protein [Clostridiales bacterium]
MKTKSTFFSPETLERIRKNAEETELKQSILDSTEKWKKMSNDQLWHSMFGSELKRSPMVLSYGWCPECGETVGLFGWICDPFDKPWKMCCPYCKESFPKNDFEKFYNSGLDEHYIFRYELADRSLLYNEDAPSIKDEKHLLYVDDGTGYWEGNDRWSFIATYVLTGLWNKHIYSSIVTLARAYVLTGEKDYAVKCGIILDRVADLFPDFDFYEQGIMYEEEHTSRGYVDYWCDSTLQLRQMLLAYDAVFEVLKDDKEYISFVVEKSEKYKTPYRKYKFKDIQWNIEHRIFGDAINNKWKIEANYPWTEMVIAVSKMVLTDWPKHPGDMDTGVYNTMWWAAEKDLNAILEQALKVDGLSGEKGLEAYSAIALESVGRLISLYSLYDNEFTQKIIQKHSKLFQGINFFINAWCLSLFYPGSGDCGYLSKPNRGIPISSGYSLFEPLNMDTNSFLFSFEGFMWTLYKLTGELNFIRYISNADNYDIKKCFTADFSLKYKPKELQKKVIDLLEEHGSELNQCSMNFEQWKLAILHSGKGKYKRCAYLDYDSGGIHGHNDGMNIGIFAKGMNFMPDLGYPPAHRPGGWNSKFFYWYRSAASHNTVIVDGKEHRDYCYVQRNVKGGQGLVSESGETRLWGIGQWVKVITVNDPLITNTERFERTLAIIDISEEECYFVDIFRIKGGSEHVKLTRGSICDMKINNLNMKPYTPEKDPFGMGFIRDENRAENFSYSLGSDFKFVRDMYIDENPPENWNARWKYKDKFKGYLNTPNGREIFLNYRELTEDIKVISFTSFFDSYYAVQACYPEELKEKKGHPEEMLPGVAVLRRGDSGLSSTFTGIYEPCESRSSISSVKKLKVLNIKDGYGKEAADRNGLETVDINKEDHVGIEVLSVNGCSDVIIAADMEAVGILYQPEWDIETDAAFCIIREDENKDYKITLMKGSYLKFKDWKLVLDGVTDIYETLLKSV